MTILKRNIQPPVNGIIIPPLQEPATIGLNNGLKLHFLEGGSQGVAKVDFIFPAGSVQAAKSLVASTTNTILAEGTKSMTSSEVSEKLDYYGAYLWQYTNYHYSVFTFFCLSRYLPELLPLVEEIIKDPVFPQEELDIYLNRRRQEFLVDLQKVKILSARKFNKTMFGEGHPYSNMLEMHSFENITRNDVVDFHRRTYSPTNAHIIAAGLPGNDFADLIDRHFGQNWESMPTIDDQLEVNHKPGKAFVLEQHDWAIQSSVRIGRPLFNRNHPDYIPLSILNTVLGGYFGSRLMTNIREEKGLTYGIGSSIVPMKYSGYWMISTEVKAENRELAVQEIFNELDKLRNEPIGDDELDLVKNYLMGEMIRTFDGPLATSDQFRGQLVAGLGMNYFNRYAEIINSITSDQLHQLAQTYLKREDFITVVAGK